MASPTASRTAARIESPTGKSALVVPVPCQVMDQPPARSGRLSAARPTTSTRPPRASGSVAWSFFSSTSDLATASRARARGFAAAASCAPARSDGFVETLAPSTTWNSPARILTRRIRVTASSMRAIGISPACTDAMVCAMKLFQSNGTITMSTPASMAAGHESVAHACVLPGASTKLTWPMASQSVTTKPSKPQRVFSRSVSRYLLPVFLTLENASARPVSSRPVNVQLLNDAITVCTPAAMAET